jgi:hypothetical protein
VKGSPTPSTKENGLVLYRYSTNACQSCAIKHSCTTGKERRITRWEHEHILEAVQRRLVGVARTGLQYDARHEHHKHQTANSGDEGVVLADMRPSVVADPPRAAETPDQKRFRTETKLPKITKTATSPKSRGVNATASAFLHDQDPERT